MDYQNDINEIVSFIHGALPESLADYTDCLARFKAPVDEPFLQERADAILEKIRTDKGLQEAFGRLAAVCLEGSGCNGCIVRKYCNSYIKTARESADKNALQMVDLFCGAGGLSLGFSQEGFVTVLSND